MEEKLPYKFSEFFSEKNLDASIDALSDKENIQLLSKSIERVN